MHRVAASRPKRPLRRNWQGNWQPAVIGKRRRPISAIESLPGNCDKHPKRPRDPNQLGKFIVDLATGERTEEKTEPPTPAQEFARSGGMKGGDARAQSLSPERRKEIA